MSTSALGSVYGKKLGRRRTFTSPKSAVQHRLEACP